MFLIYIMLCCANLKIPFLLDFLFMILYMTLILKIKNYFMPSCNRFDLRLDPDLEQFNPQNQMVKRKKSTRNQPPPSPADLNRLADEALQQVELGRWYKQESLDLDDVPLEVNHKNHFRCMFSTCTQLIPVG